MTVAVTSLRDERVARSQYKATPPYTLDPTLTFYCPQENLEAFAHPTVQAFHHYLVHDYDPAPPPHTTLLLLPCTKIKPYLLSSEHRAINAALLRHGFVPDGPSDPPAALAAALPDELAAGLLHNGLLRRGDRAIQRMVISEPMALVPYDVVYHWNGDLSPVSRYDDPGLFEERGNTVCTWRSDATGTPVGQSWRWGPAERSAYVTMHNRLVSLMTAILQRLAPRYERVVAYVSPRLTHRSFLTSTEEKAAAGLPRSRRTADRVESLTGVNDLAPGLVQVLPGPHDWQQIQERLAARLRSENPAITPEMVHSVFASGGAGATPLVLPEALDLLLRHLSMQTEET